MAGIMEEKFLWQNSKDSGRLKETVRPVLEIGTSLSLLLGRRPAVKSGLGKGNDKLPMGSGRGRWADTEPASSVRRSAAPTLPRPSLAHLGKHRTADTLTRAAVTRTKMKCYTFALKSVPQLDRTSRQKAEGGEDVAEVCVCPAGSWRRTGASLGSPSGNPCCCCKIGLNLSSILLSKKLDMQAAPFGLILSVFFITNLILMTVLHLRAFSCSKIQA